MIRSTTLCGNPQMPTDRRDEPIVEITIHRNTAGDSLDEVADFHRYELRWRLFPYQYFIDDGEEGGEPFWACHQVGALDVITPHVGGRDAPPRNRQCLGVGVNFDFRKARPPAALVATLIDTVGFLWLAAWDFNEQLGRPDIVPSIEPHDMRRKMCPGHHLDFNELRPQAVQHAHDLMTRHKHVPEAAHAEMNHLPLWWPT